MKIAFHPSHATVLCVYEAESSSWELNAVDFSHYRELFIKYCDVTRRWWCVVHYVRLLAVVSQHTIKGAMDQVPMTSDEQPLIWFVAHWNVQLKIMMLMATRTMSTISPQRRRQISHNSQCTTVTLCWPLAVTHGIIVPQKTMRVTELSILYFILLLLQLNWSCIHDVFLSSTVRSW